MFRTNFAAESADIDANAPLMVVGDNGKWGVIIFGAVQTLVLQKGTCGFPPSMWKG